MGAQASRSITDSKSLIESIGNTIIKSSISCSLNFLQRQNISLGKVEGSLDISGVSQNINSNINISCLQDSTNNSQILSDIEQELKQKAASATSGQNIGYQESNSNVISESITKVINNINLENIKNCSSNILQSQNISVETVLGDVRIREVNQSIASSVVQECLQRDTNLVLAVNELSTAIKQESQTSVAGFLTAGSLIAIVVIILVLLFLYYLFSSPSKEP